MPLTPWLSHFKTDFELARRRRQESIAFDALRCEAFDRFLLRGCPTQADEEWRYVDISPIAQTNFTLAAAPSDITSRDQIAAFLLDDIAGIDLTFVNGYFVPRLSTVNDSTDAGLIGSLQAALAAGDSPVSCFAQIANTDWLPFAALNTALFEDGACIVVPPETALDRPIHVRFVCNGEADAKPAMTQPRALIVVADRGSATVIESYAGTEDVHYFTNAVTEVALGEGARLEHYRVQRESDAAYHISAAHVIAGARSRYSAQCVNTGGALVRSETLVMLAGDGAECTVRATNVAARHACVNVHTAIDHAAANCVSRQRYRWTLTDDAIGVISGRTIVRADATNAHARLTTRARLQSPAARIEVKPTFEILAGNATCTQYSAVARCNEREGRSTDDLLAEMPFIPGRSG